jgi:hypothetical protein
LQCEKHSKKEEALAKLRDGVKFDEVAREFSEDKARQGEFTIAMTRKITKYDIPTKNFFGLKRGFIGLEDPW